MENLSLLALSYFLKTAELQHITHAAEDLCIAQPSLSRTISSLEEQLGVKLFDRKGRNIVLTPYGEILQRHTKKIFYEIEAMKDEIATAKGKSNLTVTLSIFAASKILPPILMAFQKEYPSIRLHIVQQNTRGKNSEPVHADLILSADLTSKESEYSVNLLDEEILIAMPLSHPLAEKKSILLSEVSDANFICLQPGKSLRTITDHYCALAGFIPRTILESDSPETVREFVRAGIGMSFIPSITWHGMDQGNIALVPISTPHCWRHIILSWEEKGYLSKPAELLKNHLIKEFNSLKETVQ